MRKRPRRALCFSSLHFSLIAFLRVPLYNAENQGIDTGRLAFGEATVEEGLSFTISKDEAETKRLAALLRKLLGTQPPEGANIVLVSHSGNLKEATGIWPESEGVIHIFQPHADGGFVHIGKVLPDKWGDLVRSR